MKTFLFLIVLICCTLSYINCEHKCLLRGNCGDSNKNKTIPCAEENDPIEMDGEDLELYQKLCPNLAIDKLACCDIKQLKDLQNDAELVSDVLSYCGKSYMELLCQINCSPNQNEFMKVLKKSKSSNSPDKYAVDKVSVTMENRDANKIKRACEYNYSYKLKKNILEHFRDPKKGSTLMFRIQDKVSPFEIDFHLIDRETAFHVVRNPETAELTEESVEITNVPLELDIED